MNKKVLKSLNFLRLLDENGLLSLTNLAVIIVLVKIAIADTVNLVDASALLAVISAYNFKRWSLTKNKAVVSSLTADVLEKVISLEQDVMRIKVQHGLSISEER